MSASGSRKGADVWVRQERCAHCGAAVPAGEAVEGRVRGFVYLYCAQGCGENHTSAVERWSAWCACGADAVGDSPYCDEHLDGDLGGAEVPWRLAG